MNYGGPYVHILQSRTKAVTATDMEISRGTTMIPISTDLTTDPTISTVSIMEDSTKNTDTTTTPILAEIAAPALVSFAVAAVWPTAACDYLFGLSAYHINIASYIISKRNRLVDP